MQGGFGVMDKSIKNLWAFHQPLLGYICQKWLVKPNITVCILKNYSKFIEINFNKLIILWKKRKKQGGVTVVGRAGVWRQYVGENVMESNDINVQIAEFYLPAAMNLSARKTGNTGFVSG
jgi:hypothetical protein